MHVPKSTRISLSLSLSLSLTHTHTHTHTHTTIALACTHILLRVTARSNNGAGVQATIHSKDMVHGDLTTSNLMVREGTSQVVSSLRAMAEELRSNLRCRAGMGSKSIPAVVSRARVFNRVHRSAVRALSL